jgi:hypothetical protein
MMSRLKLAGIVLTVGALTALSSWGIYTIPAPVVDRILESDLRHAATQMNRQVVSHLEDVDATFRTGALDTRDEEFLALLPATSDIYRYKLFNDAGPAIWSTRAKDVGSVNSDTYFSNVLGLGNIVHKNEDNPLTEVDDFDRNLLGVSGPQTRHVAEIYTPDIREGRFVGAIEFYSENTPDDAMTRAEQLWQAVEAVSVRMERNPCRALRSLLALPTTRHMAPCHRT